MDYQAILQKWKTEQDTVYHVRAYFENDFLMETGMLFPSNQKVFNTLKEGGISIEKCKDIIAKAEAHFGGKIHKLDINMNTYDYSGITEEDVELILSNDRDVPFKKRKSALYDAKQNSLLIFEDGYPVYENCNGTVTRDQVALADTYC